MPLLLAVLPYRGTWSPESLRQVAFFAALLLVLGGLVFLRCRRRREERAEHLLAGCGYVCLGLGLLICLQDAYACGCWVMSGGVASLLASVVLPVFVRVKRKGPGA